MGKTSVEVKERYNKKSYEDIRLRVKKGQKEIIQAHAVKMGESLNGFITRAIEQTIEKDDADQTEV